MALTTALLVTLDDELATELTEVTIGVEVVAAADDGVMMAEECSVEDEIAELVLESMIVFVSTPAVEEAVDA